MGAMVDILRCGSFSGEKRLFEFPDVCVGWRILWGL